MPWWSWLVIWTVLVLGLLGMLAFFAFWLFRKVVAAGREAGDLLEKTEILSRRAEELAPERFEPAVLADAEELREERRERLAARAIARQARRDARVRRGRLLVDVDPETVPDRFAHLIRRT
jgi:flagellar biosynthesis/type III secretory pathway M-ring protein FliF/YscJ